jgi:maleate isomerase
MAKQGFKNFYKPRYSNNHRLGLIVPSLNVTIEPEFNAVVPNDITILATRLMLEQGDLKSLERMAKLTEQACDLLSSAVVDVVAYACTTGSLVKGLEWESRLIERMQSRTRARVITTAGAVIDALKIMGLKKVAVGTPYTEELNEVEQKFLQSNGIKVVKMKGLGCVKGEDLHKYSPEKTKGLAFDVDSKEAEGIFLSCTDLKTVTVIEEIEKELRKPVISSNMATLWKALTVMKYKREKIPYCGSLLRQFL